MSKQNISDRPETLDYLLNEKIPISDRLTEYNKHDNLAFITSPSMLYPHFDNLVCGNEDYIKAFWAEKLKAVKTIQEKQSTLDYEAFVNYLFNEIGVFKNKRTIHGTKENNWQETVIYDITPTSEQQSEVLESISIEYAKANAGTFFKKPSRFGKKNLLIPFVSFESLKKDLQESLGKPYADKEQVILDYRKQYLEPLQETETESTAQTIYRNFKTGKTANSAGKDYFYYATKGAVIELMKFENYINQSDVWEQENQQYQITKQSTHFFKHTQNYIFSETEKRRIEHQMKKEDAEKYYKNKVADANGNYKITYKPDIDNKLNSALKRDYNVFNERNKNYRIESFSKLGNVEIFKIQNTEYLIESNETEKGNYTINIYNYEYNQKWLKFLNDLLGNYCFGQISGIKEDIIEDAKKKQINDIEVFAQTIEDLFFHCLDFHNNKGFEGVNHTTERNTLFRYINMNGGIFWWKQEKENEVNKSIGSLFQELEDLFIGAKPSAFLQTRDLIIFWIEKIINITINNETKMFQWGYSPFMDDVFNLGDKIKELFSDERINQKNNLLGTSYDTNQQSNEDKPDEVKATHPKHDPNLWSVNCYELYKYLFENYYKGTKRQLTNIWFYLKEYDPLTYNLKATKDKYKYFIKSNYQIEIKNFDKSQTKYSENDYPNMDEHRQNFETTLK